MKTSLARRAVAEFVGTALLLAAVVGSGIMAERLSGGNVGLALLANALATGAALAVIIYALGPVSGAHLNPVVTICFAAFGDIKRRDLFSYLLAQLAGAVTGVAIAGAMFGLPAFAFSTHA